MRVAAGLAAAFVCSAALATGPVQRTLSFEERVNAQAAIERVYYAHQIGATKSFDEAVPRAVLENKVRKYLEQTVALQSYWTTSVTDETLQRELERMAQGTRMPERLQELYTALGNDPFLNKECLARPALVDRLTHNFYAFDPTMHANARAQAEAIHQLLATGALSPKADHPNRTVSEIVVGEADSGQPTPGLPMQQRVPQGELQKRRTELPAAVGEVSDVKESREAFAFNVILSETSTGFRVASYVVPKTTWDTWWGTAHGSFASASVAAVAASAKTSVRLPAIYRGPSIGQVTSCADDGWDNGSLDDLPDSRVAHTAVWTGSQMLVWGGQHGTGGYLNTGGRYDPATDTWTSMSTTGAPTPRVLPTAVWTGSVMIVWGGSQLGSDLNTGGRYDPATDSWTPTSTSGAPSARHNHTAVWAGNLLVVWGGHLGFNGGYTDTGGRYDPTSDHWTPTATTGAPSGRSQHTVVWTGNLMVVWGGLDADSTNGRPAVSAGGRYDPVTDTWSPTAFGGVPEGRYGHSAVWTGHLMVIWGGNRLVPDTNPLGLTASSRPEPVNTGGRYDPSTDRWTATSTAGAPSPRSNHNAVWTGHLMVIWGSTSSYANPGGRYDPATNSWTPMSATGSPSGRQSPTVVWTGRLMIVWGGYGGGDPRTDYLDTGGRYDPWTDSWTPTSTGGGPSPRGGHTAVWTGSLMVVWGGTAGLYPTDITTGGRYDPTMDNWTPTSTTGAPSARDGHTAVWTGSLMIVWGGSNYYALPNDGGRYDPIADSWTPTPTNGAPSTRYYHTAVWTGSRMVVWGGLGSSGFLDTGGTYDPAADSWTPTSPSGAPSPRIYHTAVWTGSLMVVWGGYFQDNTQFINLDSGGRYDPAADRWTPTSTSGAPSGRSNHTADWAGNVMVVWGGYSDDPTSTGGRYDPVADGWTATSMTGAPSPRYNHTAVSTGSWVMVWGGYFSSPGSGAGAWYDPAADHWTKLSDIGKPGWRVSHTAVWTGSAMIIWGGNNGPYLDTGGRYFLGTSLDDDCDGDGFSASAGDCNDHDASVYPGAAQICDGINNDCSDAAWPTASNEIDFDQDGFRICQGDCDDSNALVYPGAPQLCDGINDDCSDSSWPFASESDADRDGYRVCQGDCDDTNRFVYPGRPEFCDGLDNDCDGVIDNGGDALCHHSNPCYVGVCGGTIGCEFTLTDNACDDGNKCTSGDVCSHGDCHGTPVAGGACDDGNVCTNGDVCTSGGWCQGTPLNGDSCDDGNACTTDTTCHSGYCYGGSYLSCDDGNTCNGREYCDPSIGCLSTDPPDCDDGNICTTDACDPATGCFSTNNVDPCDDGNACTDGDTCDDGLCLPGSALTCDDYNPCTSDTCDPQSGCVHVPEPEFTYCDDYDACTGADYCDGYGTCVSAYPPQCDDHVVCTEDYCDPATGCAYRMYPAGTSCSDDDACNGVELCDGAGGCAPGAPLICNDNNPCTDDSCSPGAGCVHTNNTGACNDGNACTRADVCSNGTCVGSNPVVCGALDQCHAIGVCDPASGACSNSSRPDGTVCNDASLCTTGETCQSGTCTPAFSGLNEPNPRSNGYYMRLCLGPHSGDQLTDADAVCVGQVATSFAGIATVTDLCAVLRPQHPNNDPCDRTSADLMVLALNICRARVCTAQSIDSQCGNNGNVGQSLAESDAILQSPSRDDDTCAHAKCLGEEINTGRALELNSLGLRKEGSAIRLDWRPPYLDDGTGHPSNYHVWRRVQGSLAPFAKIGTTTNPTYLDAAAGSGAFEYEVTAVMN